MAELVMENPLQKPSGSTVQILISKTVSEIKDCVNDMKKGWEETSGYPITDDSQSLQRFFAKLELLLQTELKQKSSLLSGKKDYWNYFCSQLANDKSLNDGIRFVKSLKELKSNLGRGRAFIRYLIVHHRLADTLQHCLMNTSIIKEWYLSKSIFHRKELSEELLSSLYDLNEIQFDLAPTGYDLDASWPTFARKGGMGVWKLPSRSNSIISLGSSIPRMDSLQNMSYSLPPDIDEYCNSSMISVTAEDAELLEELSSKNKELEAENKKLLQRCASLDYTVRDLSERCIKLTEHEASLTDIISGFKSRVSLTESAAAEQQAAAAAADVTVDDNPAFMSALDISALDDSLPDSALDESVSASALDESVSASALDDSLPDSALDESVSASALDESVSASALVESVSASGLDESVSASALDESVPASALDESVPASEVSAAEKIGLRPDVDLSSLSKEELVITVEGLQKQFEEVSSRREALQEELLKVKENFASASNTLADFRSELESLQENNSKLDKNSNDTEINTVGGHGNGRGFFEKAYQDVLKDKLELEVKLENFEDYRKSATELYEGKISQQEETISKLEERIAQYGASGKSEKEQDKDKNSSVSLSAQAASDQLQSSSDSQKVTDKKVSSLTSQLEKLKNESETLKVKVTESKSLVKDLESKNNAMKEATKQTISENESLKKEGTQLKTRCSELESKVNSLTEKSDNQVEKLKELESMLESRERELKVIKAELESVKEERDKVTGNLKGDLEMMTGSVQRREKNWENMRVSMEKEIKSLRFDLNSQIAAQKAKIRELQQLVVDEATKPKLAEQKSMIELLQLTNQNLKKEQEIEQERAREQLDDLKECMGALEAERASFRQQMEQKDEETENEREKWREAEEKFSSKIAAWQDKVQELLIDKERLWKKKYELSNQRKLRRSFHWMDSNEVSNCLDCKVVFTMSLRKHHCRECGRVLCWTCCSNFIFTPHSGNKERVCDLCIKDLSNLEVASSDSETDTVEDEIEARRRLSRSTSSSDGSLSTRENIVDMPQLYSQSIGSNDINHSTDLNPFTEATATFRMCPGDFASDNQTTESTDSRPQNQNTTAETATSAAVQADTAAAAVQAATAAAAVEAATCTAAVAEGTTADDILASGDQVGLQESWRVTDQAKAAVTWLTSTTSLLAANVLPGTLRRPASAEVASKSKKEASNDVLSEKSSSLDSKRSRSNSGDAFDVFSSEEFSDSLLYPPPDPNIICISLVKLEDFDSQECIEGPSDLFVKAGRSCAVPVFIDQIDATLLWEFSTQPKGIVFSITYNESASASSDTSEQLIAPCRVNSHVKPAEGELQARRVGVYTLFFDNNQSRFTGKKISYKLRAKRPLSLDISTLAAESTVVS